MKRSAEIGQAAMRFCQARWSRCGSKLTCADHSSTCAAHSPGISDSTDSRARTSSERLVSWVDRVVIEYGGISWQKAWKSATLVPKTSGSPPTSFRQASGNHR